MHNFSCYVFHCIFQKCQIDFRLEMVLKSKPETSAKSRSTVKAKTPCCPLTILPSSETALSCIHTLITTNFLEAQTCTKTRLRRWSIFHNDGMVMFFSKAPLPSMVFQWFYHPWTITIECFFADQPLKSVVFQWFFQIQLRWSAMVLTL